MKRIKPDPDQLPLPFRIDVNKLLFRRFGISTHAKHLLRIMCSLLGAKPIAVKHVFKSQAAFAEAMEVKVRVVQYAMTELKNRGVVYKDRRPRKGLMCTTWGLRTSVIWELAGVNLVESTSNACGSIDESTRNTCGSICEPTSNTCGSIDQPTSNACGSTGQPTRNTCGSICSDVQKTAENNEEKTKAHSVNHCMVLNKLEPMNHGDDGKDDGAFKKSEKKTVQKWLDRQLTARDLVDAETVGDLFDYAVASNRWPAGERGEHEFFTLCVHCAEDADVPGALLTGVVFLGKSAKPTNAQELRAEQLLLQRRRARPVSHGTAVVAARVAESMTPAAPVNRPYREIIARLKERAAKERNQ